MCAIASEEHGVCIFLRLGVHSVTVATHQCADFQGQGFVCPLG